MEINKLDTHTYETLVDSLKNYIRAWHKIPFGIDIENLKIKRIRYIKEWGFVKAPEDGFILEIETTDDLYIELLGRSELNMTVEQIKEALIVQNENGLLFGKEFISNEGWHRYPVVWGTLDKVFDNKRDYEQGGRYASFDYLSFEKKK